MSKDVRFSQGLWTGSHPGPFPWMGPAGSGQGPRPAPDHQGTRDLVTATTLAFEGNEYDKLNLIISCQLPLVSRVWPAGWPGHHRCTSSIWPPGFGSGFPPYIQVVSMESRLLTSDKLIDLLTYELINMRTGAGLVTGWGPLFFTILTSLPDRVCVRAAEPKRFPGWSNTTTSKPGTPTRMSIANRREPCLAP